MKWWKNPVIEQAKEDEAAGRVPKGYTQQCNRQLNVLDSLPEDQKYATISWTGPNQDIPVFGQVDPPSDQRSGNIGTILSVVLLGMLILGLCLGASAMFPNPHYERNVSATMDAAYAAPAAIPQTTEKTGCLPIPGLVLGVSGVLLRLKVRKEIL